MTPASHPPPQRLVEIWLGFLIKHQGRWNAAEERGLRAWAEYGHTVADWEFDAARSAALDIWHQARRRVVVCAGAVCCQKRPRPTAADLAHLESIHQCPAIVSDCQNRCRQAPSVMMIDPVANPGRPASPVA